jgi:hypothetical protein
MNHDVKLGNMTPEKSLTYPRRNVLAHFIGFIDYVFPEVMLGDLASGELNDIFEKLSLQKTATVFIIVKNIMWSIIAKKVRRAKYIDEISDSIKNNYINVSFDFISK